MHVVPPTVRTVVVLAGVTVLLGLHNPPCSWTGMVGPSLPNFTIAPCVDSLLCYRLIRRPKEKNRSLYMCAEDVQITRIATI
jgi:hypothetical protein